MTIATEFIALLERCASVAPLPRVRALHLPAVAAQATKDGEFCALELDDGSFGLTYLLLDDTFQRLLAAAPGLGLAGADPLVLARRYAESGPLARTLGFAAVNAISRCFFARVGYEPDWTTDSVAQLDPLPADHIGMIGLFPPLVARIVASGARLTVAELRADLAGEREGYRVTLDPADLAGCNKVISTSTLLLNDTLEPMLAACRSAGFFSLIGPGAGCLPDPLFARGISLIGGTWITDAAGFRDAMATGANWGRCARKYCIRASGYVGFEALLARLRT
ncbi:MAG: hypothetical protein KF778_09470 [Rhodocyclaceae bacterium]|nr:hypothetical protein [Rhodocyclaceae bacterium]MBX3668618.1 hypothetical protein [Rhodocyclaceae bacterium]